MPRYNPIIGGLEYDAAEIRQQENERIRTLPCIETMANELMLLRVEVTKLQNAQEENKALREEVARLRQALLETLDLLQSLSVAAAAGKN